MYIAFPFGNVNKTIDMNKGITTTNNTRLKKKLQKSAGEICIELQAVFYPTLYNITSTLAMPSYLAVLFSLFFSPVLGFRQS